MSNHEPASFGWHSARTAKVFYVIFVDEEIVVPHNPASLDNEEDGTVGCISWSRIPPPHTVNALKRAICKAEQIAHPAAYDLFKTFVDVESLDEAQKVVLQSGQYPGVDPSEPIVLVNKRLALDDVDESSSSIPVATSLPTLGVAPSSVLTDNPTRKVVYGQELITPSNTFLGHTAVVNAVAFSPDGLLLASASTDKTVQIFHTASATLVSKFQGHTDAVMAVVFSPDGSQIATGSNDKTARFWDAAKGNFQKLLKRYASGVKAIAFSPDSSRLAAGLADSTSTIHDLHTGKHLGTLKGVPCGEPITFSPDSSELASPVTSYGFQIWNVESKASRVTLNGHSNHVKAIAWSSKGSLIASGDGNGAIRIWAATSGDLLVTLQDPSSLVAISLAFSPDDSHIISASGRIRVWNLASGALLRSMFLLDRPSAVLSFAVSLDRLFLATGFSDGSVRTWSIA